MKALSIIQPWAWLIVAGHKDVENRDWGMGRITQARKMIGERIVIHASKEARNREFEYATGVVRTLMHPKTVSFRIPDRKDLSLGAAIGTARIKNLVVRLESMDLTKYDQGDLGGLLVHHPSPWFFGPIGIVLSEPVEWKTPVPYKGALGFWEFPDALIPEVPPRQESGFQREFEAFKP